jgi:hypothetical protein
VGAEGPTHLLCPSAPSPHRRPHIGPLVTQPSRPAPLFAGRRLAVQLAVQAGGPADGAVWQAWRWQHQNGQRRGPRGEGAAALPLPLLLTPVPLARLPLPPPQLLAAVAVRPGTAPRRSWLARCRGRAARAQRLPRLCCVLPVEQRAGDAPQVTSMFMSACAQLAVPKDADVVILEFAS